MNWAVVVEGCKLVGSCEDMHGEFLFLGCVREMWPCKREEKVYLGYDNEFTLIES